MKTNKFTLGAIAGISSIALAVPILAQFASAQSTPTQPVAQQTSSIQTDATETPDTPGTADQQDGNEANESPDSPVDPSLAKINADVAKTTALTAQPGTINKTELEDENGTIVYGFEIQNGNKTVDVKVDAATGKVIKIEQDDGEIDDAKETHMESQEKNEPAGQELKD